MRVLLKLFCNGCKKPFREMFPTNDDWPEDAQEILKKNIGKPYVHECGPGRYGAATVIGATEE